MFGRRTARAFGVTFVGVGALAVLWSATAGAGGGGHGGSICPGYAEGPTIKMFDNCFMGTTHFVEPKSTITVTNSGQLPHSLTAVDGSIDTGTLEPGTSATVKVGDAGVVRLYCTLHGSRDGGGMTGVLVVGDGGKATDATLPANAKSVSARAAPAQAESGGLSGLASLALVTALFGAGLGTAGLAFQLVRLRK
jgi:plastocyanin